MKQRRLQKMVNIALIAALYTAASLALAPVAFGTVQFRVAEALTLLPLLMPEAILGVVLGCALTNIAGVVMQTNILGIVDVFVGTFATLLAALATYQLRNVRIKNIPVLALIPPILFNAIAIGAELSILLGNGFSWILFWPNAGSVAVGQIMACGVIGIPLVVALERLPYFKKKQSCGK